uniref:Uncharacterized protein n=1 Tax=Triticum urartu TaxID=4572 RepID=A0A8R7Q8X0_TRIUA
TDGASTHGTPSPAGFGNVQSRPLPFSVQSKPPSSSSSVRPLSTGFTRPDPIEHPNFSREHPTRSRRDRIARLASSGPSKQASKRWRRWCRRWPSTSWCSSATRRWARPPSSPASCTTSSTPPTRPPSGSISSPRPCTSRTARFAYSY